MITSTCSIRSHSTTIRLLMLARYNRAYSIVFLHNFRPADIMKVTLSLEAVCSILFFFFFQAVDGIRDWSVTGVQTCALPICLGEPGPQRSGGERLRQRRQARLLAVRPSHHPGRSIAGTPASLLHCSGGSTRPGRRSEERRVGKECRSRCSQYH